MPDVVFPWKNENINGSNPMLKGNAYQVNSIVNHYNSYISINFSDHF